jgi:hypothetical protein
MKRACPTEHNADIPCELCQVSAGGNSAGRSGGQLSGL